MSKGYMYILKCCDNSYYTGSTKDLELRFEQHQTGFGANYTKKRLPVELIYFEEFDRIDDAFFREKQIQGWSRKKKEALMKNKTEKLHELAKCKNKSSCFDFAQQPNFDFAQLPSSSLSEVEVRLLSVAEAKRDKMKNIPKLRFKEFSGEWEEKRMKDIASINQGLQIPISERYTEKVENSYFYITNEFLKKSSKYKYFIKNPPKSAMCDEDDILMTRTGNTGQVVTDIKGVFHNNFFIIKYLKTIDKDFLVNFLKLPTTQNMILRYAGTSTIPDLNHSDFYRLKINLPQKQEQEKIASFLTSIDTKIEQLTKKHSLLTSYKKALMQKIFTQQIRFCFDYAQQPLSTNTKTAEHIQNKIAEHKKYKVTGHGKTKVAERSRSFPDWEEKKFGEVFERITTKNKENNQNILTISAQDGLINQQEFFNKSVSAKDVTGYYLLERGDFAYNKSYSKGYPMGAIKKLNRYDKGVVSTLYICFKIKNGNSNFYEQVFDSGILNKEIHKIAQEGARNHGLLNISVIDFFNTIRVPFPCVEEQTKIANFLSSCDEKINSTKTELKQIKEFKKGLLQQMFV